WGDLGRECTAPKSQTAVIVASHSLLFCQTIGRLELRRGGQGTWFQQRHSRLSRGRRCQRPYSAGGKSYRGLTCRMVRQMDDGSCFTVTTEQPVIRSKNVSSCSAFLRISA